MHGHLSQSRQIKNIYIMHINDTDPARARMLAEQMVTKLASGVRWPMEQGVKEALTESLLKSGAAANLLFRNKMYQPRTPYWTISGLLAHIIVRIQEWWTPTYRSDDANDREDEQAELSPVAKTHYKIRSSGAVGLIIALLIGLIVALSNISKPLEIGVQAGRDALRQQAASGDIVVIAADERSAQQFGRPPWPRRYDAQLVDRLRALGVKQIVYNQVMADTTTPADDAALAAAFDRAKGKLWLSMSYRTDAVTGKQTPLLPTPLFRSKTQQAHISAWYNNAYGHIEKFFGTLQIGDVIYRSQAAVLAQADAPEVLRPDYAIDHRSIKTISAVDVVQGRVGRDVLEGKTAFVVITGDASAIIAPVLGQGRAPVGYSIAIAAETIKAGVARELGFLLPLLLVALMGVACVIRRASRLRHLIILGGSAGLVMMIFAGDQLGIHFTVVPALLALCLFGYREAVRSKVMAALTKHTASDLPDLAHIRMINGYKRCTVIAIKCGSYDEKIGKYGIGNQKLVAQTIASRINIVLPHCVVHQGDAGLFVVLVPPDNQTGMATVPGQLSALLAMDIVGHHGMHMLDVSVGACSDFARSFTSRLDLARDRAERGVYVTLYEVK